MPTTRTYIVEIGEKKRLVKATHPSHVYMHVARDMAKVRVPTQDELVACVQAGVVVESIKAEQHELAG